MIPAILEKSKNCNLSHLKKTKSSKILIKILIYQFYRYLISSSIKFNEFKLLVKTKLNLDNK